MAGKLEMDVGGMYAEKSTNLIRKAKRKIRAGKKVVFLKPMLDNRYAEDAVVTHDGVSFDAVNVFVQGELLDENFIDSVLTADVICIDEIQFFPKRMIHLIDSFLYQNKDVYVAGLDMDRFGKPFGIVPYLLARAEVVTKHSAVCAFCGNDAWVTIGTEKLNNNIQVNVGNDYEPACRTCAEKHGGVR